MFIQCGFCQAPYICTSNLGEQLQERLGYPVSDIEIGLAYHLLCRSRSRCWNIVSKVAICPWDKYLLNACVYSPCLACGYAQCIILARSYAVRYLRDTASLCRVTRTAQTRAMLETMTSTHSMVTSSSPIPFPLSEKQDSPISLQSHAKQ